MKLFLFTILKFMGLLFFYNFAANRPTIASRFLLLKASCVLTLARKLKLKIMRKVFRNFKGILKRPDSDIEIYSPTSLKVIHDFNSSTNNPEKVLQQSWAGKLTKSSFEKVCVICGSSKDIEMHHLRSVL